MVKFRKMAQSDLIDVISIEKEAFGTESYDDFVTCISRPIYYYIVLEKDGEIIGYYGAMIIGDECEILTIAVKKGFRRQGYGKSLLDNIIDRAKAHKCKVLYLEVNENNNIASSLYLKKGFVESYRRNGYYGKDDALILKLEL